MSLEELREEGISDGGRGAMLIIHLQLPGIETREKLDAFIRTCGFRNHYSIASVRWEYGAEGCDGWNYLLIEQTADGALNLDFEVPWRGKHRVSVISGDSLEPAEFLCNLVDVILLSWLDYSIMAVDWTDVIKILQTGNQAVLLTKPLGNKSAEEINAVMDSSIDSINPQGRLCGAILTLSGSNLSLRDHIVTGEAWEAAVGPDQDGLIGDMGSDRSDTSLSILSIYS